jgi:hypothetical protein
MKQRGRKSTSHLSVVPFARAPMEPPTSAAFNAREEQHFRTIVATKPADYFSHENVGLLIALVRAMATLDKLAAALNESSFEEFVDQYGVRELSRLLDMCERQGRLMLMLMTKLRLTPSTRIRAETAATIATHAPTLPRPWSPN